MRPAGTVNVGLMDFVSIEFCIVTVNNKTTG